MAMLFIVAGGTLLGVGGCAGSAPGLPPETGFSTTGLSTTGVTAVTTDTTGAAVSDGGSGVPSDVPSDVPSGCTSDEQCGGQTPACDPSSGDCLPCRPAGEYCAPEEYCDPDAFECLPGCDDDTDCPGVCDVEAHVCVECVDAGDCAEPTPVCDGRSNTCVECVVASDCPTGTCELQQCVSLGFECMDDTVCDTAAGEECCLVDACLDRCMVPCGSDEDCPTGGPMMDCHDDYCLFLCRNDADCAAWPGFICSGGPGPDRCERP